MKKIIFIVLTILVTSYSGFARTIELDVYGMTCSFCVDSLQRKFNKMEHITSVKVSLKLKKIRLETDNQNSPTLEEVKQTVLNSGFTPVNIEVQDEKK